MQANDLKDWTLLKSLDTSNLKKVYVFGATAVILRNNGTMYGIGSNEHHLIGNNSETYFYSSFTEISGPTKFKDFSTNGEHAVAISEKGFLYSWGSNEHGQLGRAGSNFSVLQVTKMFAVRVKDAVCGTGYTCVLTEDGRVFEWGIYGFNELILDSHSEIENEDEKEENDDEKEENDKIISIHGTKHYVMILTENGKVFIPPYKRAINICSLNLHIEKTYAFEGPLKNKRIKQILSGKSYAFALTIGGEIFHWSVYACKCNGQHEPKHIGENIGRVIKLWAAMSDDILVAANGFGDLYSITWSASEILPMISKINFSSAEKYFANLGILIQGPVYNQITLTINVEENTDVLSKWRGRFDRAFNNEEDSDISFIVGDGIIYAHRTILSIQSSYLNALLKSDWKENTGNNHVTIRGYSYDTYFKYMRYLYTGKLEFTTSHEGKLELFRLAHEYNEEPLLDRCKDLVIRGLTAENAFTTFNIANIFGLEDVRQACKSFISDNLQSVILSDDTTNQDKDMLIRCVRDMVCSKNIVGNK